ncbi:hypothetical protein J7E93_34750 [Streptomyces sp. ISL-36]|uniref:DUF6924 domain-containing protein n=1 Tax=Streptomyces sp. ISL-36 TaxID=2819182 RepID=UPI001BED39DC|nr:hypothetical protein [Streptomyces sp. ISL-36]MBT2445156.1 hypothetical protein [Streptomyces sp. ISL-36]
MPEHRPPLVIRIDYGDESAWHAVRAALAEDPDLSAHIVDDPLWAGAPADEVLAAVGADEELSVVFLADAATMASAHHALLAVTTVTRAECEDDEEYALLTGFGDRFRTVPAGVHDVHANLSLATMGFEEYAEAAHEDPEGIFRRF